MKDDPSTVDTATAELTQRNIEITGQFLQEMLADPSLMDTIPDGATIVTLPYGDPALGLRNLALASRLASAGTRVALRRSGVPEDEVEQERRQDHGGPDLAPWLAAHWDGRAYMAIRNDARAATVAILFFGKDEREPLRLPISARTSLLVDLGSNEIIGYEVPAAWVAQLRPGGRTTPGLAATAARLSSNSAEASAVFTEELARAAA